MDVIRAKLRETFKDDTIDLSDGYDENIHIVVVSRKFDKMGEKSRQAYLWRLIEKTNLTETEKDLVTVLLAYSPGELK
jgi:hypothetical protein